MAHDITIQIILLAISGIAAQWLGWKFHTPSILFLLAFGFLLGPISGLVSPSILLGDFLQPAISAAVAIILFEGALQLNFKGLRETAGAIKRVIFLGAPIGWGLISLCAHYVAGLGWPTAITLGGMLIVTGPTVIMPMLRQARLNMRIGSILKWEGIVNDPLGILFAILTYEYFIATQNGMSSTNFMLSNLGILCIIALLSYILARAIKYIFEHGHMPEYLKTPFLLSIVLALFFSANLALHESGLVAVTVLGLTLTNIKTPSMEGIKRFKETITILLVSGVFLLLTAGLDLKVLLQLDWHGLVFIALLLFAIRPLTFALCTIGTQMTRQEVMLAGFIAPRGVVCAAMAGVIGPMLTNAGFADGDKILPLAFAVVLISVGLHSLSIKPLARYLKLTSNKTNGLIIAGAYPWSIQMAETLTERNVPVMLVDNNWHALGRARLGGLPVYYGELMSEETEFSLEFSTYNTLLAATPNPSHNALLCEKFGYDYGAERVFRLGYNDSVLAKHRQMPKHMHGRPLITKDMDLDAIYDLFEDGWRFKTTRVGKAEGQDTLIIPTEGEARIHVGYISKAGILNLYSSNGPARANLKEDDIILIFEKPEISTKQPTSPA